MTKREASIIALRKCAEMIESTAECLVDFDERLKGLCVNDQVLIEGQAREIAKAMMAKANQLERAKVRS